MRLKFERHGIRGVRRFAATDGQALTCPPNWSSTKGAYGCLLSHLQVVCEARSLGAPSVLIFEDDVEFHARFQDLFSTYVQQVPDDWEILYFGALHMEDPIRISENVYRVGRAYSTYAYALKDAIFDTFIESNTDAVSAIDVNNLALQMNHKCYCFVPHVAWVESGESDVQERQNNHWYLKESLVIHGRGMNDLLNRTSLIIAHTNPTRNKGVTQNLLFLTRFYDERLAGIEIVIVEQGPKSTIDAADLPRGSRHLLLQEDGPINRGLYFNAGMNDLHPRYEFMIFSDSDVFMEEWDICANLRMCERFDCTTGFRSMIELSSKDTQQLYGETAMLMRWFDAKKYSIVAKDDPFSKYSVFKRESIRAAGGWDEHLQTNVALPLSLKERSELKVFQPPNHAWRLWQE